MLNKISNKTQGSENKSNIQNYIKFILPSLLGVLLFICPIKSNGDITIPIAVCSEFLQSILSDYSGQIIYTIIAVSFFGSVILKLMVAIQGEACVKKTSFLKSVFGGTLFSLILRGISFGIATIIVLNINLPIINSSATGVFVFSELLPILFAVFFLAGLFLPLLLNFGLLEFAGTLLQKVMRPVFNLPGRSAIDAIASWLGDGTIGVLLTGKQYEEKRYTERDACVIGTNFSLVSITFSIVVINTVGLPNMFLPFYLTVTFACIIAAIVVPKLPPLSRKKNKLIDGSDPETESIPTDMSNVKYGVKMALECVEGKNVMKTIIIDGMKNVIDMWLGVIPVVLTIGTFALILAEYTPLFTILGYPFVPFLKLLGIPEAVAASQTLFAGFADMLLPSVMIANVSSELTRFVVAAVSVSQLIYLSEVGALLLASKIPVKIGELFVIFVERTIITLPIIAVIAHVIF